VKGYEEKHAVRNGLEQKAGETLEFTTGLPLGASTMDSGFTAVRGM
jgi:hypothetical protein